MINQKISIVIRTRNEERHIGYSIQSCIDNFTNPEIIIVDDNSLDETLKIISLFDKHDIKVFKIKKSYSPGYSLNAFQMQEWFSFSFISTLSNNQNGFKIS